MRKINYLIAFVAILSANSCSNNKHKNYTVIKGETMGSTYEICYDSNINIKENIDYMLGYYSFLFSTYDSNSILSSYNNNKTLTEEQYSSYLQSINIFKEIDQLSFTAFSNSSGAFNPSINELINYWGFGANKKTPYQVDDNKIKELLNLTCPNFLVYFNQMKKPEKMCYNHQLNYNAIAAGHAVDFIYRMMDSIYGFKNFYINITGEIKTKGKAQNDSCWKIKIEKPQENSNGKEAIEEISLCNQAIATSGNYRNFYNKNGKKIGHSINARTGYPAQNEMLSASIICPSAALADAYATACMVLGLEQAKSMIEYLKINAILIYEDNGKMRVWKNF